MSCVNNLDRLILPNDIIVQLTKVYKYIGCNDYYEKVFKSDLDIVVDQTVERDAFFLAQILKLDLTDARMRLIITKDSTPRKKEETTLSNIKETLMGFQLNFKTIRYQSNDIFNLVNYVFSHYNPIKYDYIPLDKKTPLVSQNMRSKRVLLDEIIDNIYRYLETESFEEITLYIHFFIDFYNLKPFVSNNEPAAYLLLYLLLLKADVHAFRYVSLIEQIYNNFDKFETELKNASFNWEEGYAQTLGFIRFMLNLIINSYEKVEEITKNYKFDQALNKTDNIENTILKFEHTFTKEDIRLMHPYVSESTINRTLARMKENGDIRPLGRGRSAKWIKNDDMR